GRSRRNLLNPADGAVMKVPHASRRPSVIAGRGAFALALLVSLSAPVGLRAQAARGQDPSRVTVERIYNTRDFRGESFGPVRWLDDSTYTVVEPGPEGRGTQLVRVDAATGR